MCLTLKIQSQEMSDNVETYKNSVIVQGISYKNFTNVPILTATKIVTLLKQMKHHKSLSGEPNYDECNGSIACYRILLHVKIT